MSQRYIGGLIYNPPGGFSGYFDGSGDYLSGIGTTSSFNFLHNTTALFTIEAWVFVTVGSSYNTIIDTNASASANIGCWFAVNNDNKLRVFITKGSAGSPVIDVSSSTTVPLNQWVHVAVTYDQSLGSNNATFYINGVASGNGTKTANPPSNSNATYALQVSAASGGSAYFNGYISNLRINNSIVYSAAFTPPVGQLQAITNTSLLTCAYSTFRDGSSNNFTITVNGNTAVSTQNPFPLTQLPVPALGNQGNGVYSMSQYQALKQQNLWPSIDQYWPYVTMMLHGNGTNGAQNNTFLDSSTNNFTITRNGNTTQGTFTPYGANWSNYFDGTGDYLTAASNAAFSPGTGDFTWEAWLFPTSWAASVAPVFVVYDTASPGSTGGLWIGKNGSNFVLRAAGVADQLTYGTMPTVNTWTHVAVVRSGSTATIYYNGVSVASGTVTYNFTQQKASIGSDDGSNYFTGYLSNARLVKGTAVYTSAFTPPTAPLTAITNTSLLTCQSNRFIDNSSNNFTITRNGDVSVQRFSPFNPTTPYAAGTIGGSGYFDGSGDYLTAPNNTAFDLSTSDFTISYWIYPTSTSAFTMIATYANGAAQNSNYCFSTSMNAGGAIRFDNFSGNSQLTVTGGTVALNAWNFVTITRSGASATVYVNNSGTTGTVYATSNLPSSSVLYVGAQPDASSPFSGYLSNFRIVKGSATAPGANPTSPLTAVSGTSLLLSMTNGGIIDNAMMNDLETVGNAQISTSVSKFGGGSMYFDGNGDYLSFINGNATTTNFGTGDFTIEGWVYPIAYSGTYIYPIFIANVASEGTTGGFTLYLNHPVGSCIFYYDSSNIYGGSPVSAGSWSHIALTRSSGTVRFFINGTQQFSGTVTNSLGISTGSTTIGVRTGNLTQTYFNGYIDDLRITKGYARYTANFTPQRSQWQDQ